MTFDIWVTKLPQYSLFITLLVAIHYRFCVGIYYVSFDAKQDKDKLHVIFSNITQFTFKVHFSLISLHGTGKLKEQMGKYAVTINIE